jgi:hypothetical protein
MKRPLIAGLAMLSLAPLVSPSAILQGILVAKTGRYWLIVSHDDDLVNASLVLIREPASCGLELYGSWHRPSVVPQKHVFNWRMVRVHAHPRFAERPPLLHYVLGLGASPSDGERCGGLVPAAYQDLPAGWWISLRRGNLPHDYLFQSWAVAIGATIMQTQLRKRLPATFLSQFAPGQDITENAIPIIAFLSPELRTEVRKAFADSLRVLWLFLLVSSCVGWISVFFMRELPLHTQRDRRFGLEDRKPQQDGEHGMKEQEKEKEEEKQQEKVEEKSVETIAPADTPEVVVDTLVSEVPRADPAISK